jgi:transcriptional regulator with XRE-family HTH domain
MTFDTYKKRLGQRLLDLRGQAELTQVEVAAKAKVTRQHLQRLEHRIRPRRSGRRRFQ